ncbi:hypothetical protein BHE74_00037501 [Ensete ventricosum]|nr:hypothetical protein GW17_00000652 [Ensete ventricosum]RWW55837.1 hypothetical protein BHE74_00037501 [Ensete ventricosum]RZS02522.1 hypothetical protein BHM03_00032575 [Ensete ventricosum]
MFKASACLLSEQIQLQDIFDQYNHSTRRSGRTLCSRTLSHKAIDLVAPERVVNTKENKHKNKAQTRTQETQNAHLGINDTRKAPSSDSDPAAPWPSPKAKIFGATRPKEGEKERVRNNVMRGKSKWLAFGEKERFEKPQRAGEQSLVRTRTNTPRLITPSTCGNDDYCLGKRELAVIIRNET